MLCGKYESNAIALRLALGITDRAIEAYDVLLALLETELSLSETNPGKINVNVQGCLMQYLFSPVYSESIENRSAAESVAKQLLTHLDSSRNTDLLLSPWQNHVYNSPVTDLYVFYT